MKNILMCTLLCVFVSVEGQVWEKVKKAAQRGLERTAEKRAEKETTEKTEDVIDIITGKGKKKKKEKEDSKASDQTNGSEDIAVNKTILDHDFTTEAIIFTEGTPNLHIDSAIMLSKIGEAMETLPDTSFLIVVFTKHPEEETLAAERAIEIKNYLASHFKVEKSQLISTSELNETIIASEDAPEDNAIKVTFKKF